MMAENKKIDLKIVTYSLTTELMSINTENSLFKNITK